MMPPPAIALFAAAETFAAGPGFNANTGPRPPRPRAARAGLC